MKFLFIFFTFLSTKIFAQTQFDIVTKDKSLYLQSKDCKILQNEVQAITAWTKRLGGPVEPPKCQCHGILNWKLCEVNVDHALPKMMSERANKGSFFDGPNCWNASMVSAKLSSYLRYTSDKEINFWLNSPLCKEREQNESPQAGDIIAIRERAASNNVQEVHAFIHISNDLSFSKNGFYSTQSYSLMPPNDVFSKYKVTENCKIQASETNKDDCQRWASYYSCHSMEDYLKEHPITNDELSQSQKSLEQIECNLSDIAFHGGEINSIRWTVIPSIQIIKFLAKEKSLDDRLSEDERFIWKGIYFKADSLVTQGNLILGRDF
ncbi:MAG: hypothetical protein AB7I27_17615 [Bacteriovoracaceae bacterium]